MKMRLLLIFIGLLSNIQLYAQCNSPSGMGTSNIGPNSAILSWTTGGATNWQIQYGITGFALGSGTIIETNINPYTLTNLDPLTAYEFYVRDSCEIGDVSDWTGAPSFSTTQQFTYISTGITGVSKSSVTWGDYDNDSDLDILLSGLSSTRICKIYQNNEGDNFNDTGIPFEGIEDGSVAWGDYDNDGDLDVFLTGYFVTGSGGRGCETDIYKNDLPDSLYFTKQSDISLTKVFRSTAEWGDYDNDGDLDIIVAGGFCGNSDQTCKIYRNEGQNQFTELSVFITPFWDGDLAWGDYDTDGDLDILISGHDYSGNPMTNIYRNDGDEVFIELSIDLTGVKFSTVDWGDCDNDNDLDILLTGSSFGESISKIYLNIGDDTFEEQTNISLRGISKGSTSWGDYDNDGDLDILLSGEYVSKIYKNNGDNTFSEQENISLQGVIEGSTSWGDYDNDGDLDILLTGSGYSRIYRNNSLIRNNKPSPPTKLFSKTGSSNAILSWNKAVDDETTDNGLSYNVVVSKFKDSLEILSPMSNLDSGYRRIVGMGNAGYDTSYTIKNLDLGKYYWSVQSIDHNYTGSTFAVIDSFNILNPFSQPFWLSGVYYSSVAWGDYDNDGDLDILLTGTSNGSSSGAISKIYKNDLPDSVYFTEQSDISLTDVYISSVAWGDYDNDGDLDILLTGTTNGSSSGAISKIYRNNGDNTFKEQTDISLTGVYVSSVAWGDYDNDGYLDILLAGLNESDKPITKIYKNNGDTTFDDQTNIALADISWGDIDFFDYDNDGDIDIIITGDTSYLTPISKIYKNNLPDSKGFTEQTNISLTPSFRGSVDLGDYDNDGDLDILLTGIDDDIYKFTKIYRNDGFDAFTDINAFIIIGVAYSSAKWGDFDNDGDLDIIISGQAAIEISKIYVNGGNDTFSEYSYRFRGAASSSLAWGDYDNDHDLDILISGESWPGAFCVIHENNGNWDNSSPTTPINLQTERYGYGIKLKWNTATDDHNPPEAISYNIRLDSVSSGIGLISPMSDSSGYRLIPKIGNCQLNKEWIIDSLPEGTYYWSVQAIDHTFLGGKWAIEDTFNITVVRADFKTDTVCLGDSTHFTDLSLTGVTEIDQWEWDFGDGTTDTLKDPTHLYDTSGYYTVQLTAYSGEHENTISKVIYVKPVAVANFYATTECFLDTTSFINLSTIDTLSIFKWEWNFDDEEESGVFEPDHIYLKAGDFNVELKITANNGCVDSTEQVVRVGGYPNATISLNGDAEFCTGDSTQLIVEYDSQYSYQWKLDDIPIAYADSNVIVAKNNGTYIVDVTNQIGNCISIATPRDVTVQPAPLSPYISYTGNTIFCQGDSIILSVTNNSELSYQWKLNGGTIGIDKNIFVAKSTGNYTLNVSNSTGCITQSTNSINVIVNDIPTITSVNLSGPIEFCSGDSLVLSVVPEDLCSYQWNNTYELLEGEINNSITVKETGDYYLNITNTSECSVLTDTISVTVNEKPNIPVIEIDGDTIFCLGDSVVLSANYVEGLTYKWKLYDDVVYSVSNEYSAKNETGLFSLEVFNQSNCSSISSDSANVTVNETPDKPVVSLSGSTNLCEGDSLILSSDEQSGVTYQWSNEQGEILNANSNQYVIYSSGSFFVDVTNLTNCTNTSNITDVTVTEMPSKPVINTTGYDINDCPQEKQITLSIDQATVQYNYQWQRNGVPMDGETESELYGFRDEGDYTVIAINGDCESESDNIEILYNPELPDKPEIIATGPNVWYLACTNDDAEQYEWYYNNEIIAGATEYLYVANQNLGTYNTRIAEENGCFVSSDAVTIPLVATGINEADPFANLKIYPNPTPGVFTIEMDNQIYGELITRIFSQNAIEILNIKFDKSTQHFKAQVDLSGQGKGLYIISFILDKYKAERKLVVE